MDAMYAGIPGVEFMDDAFYVFPCDTKLNVSVVFG